jgi:hypothetical protein
MNQSTLRKRRQELQDLCEKQKLNWKERVKGLPENDDGIIVAALATTLNFNLRKAFNPSTPIPELEREKKGQRKRPRSWTTFAVNWNR